MDQRLIDVLALLELEPLEVNLFRGDSRDIGSPQVFGGQVLGQALVAAYRTVSDRACHSLHAYFLRRGDFDAPIIYQVDRSRDGHSFSNRRVVAIQHGEQIFHMSCSFQLSEPGMDHSARMPDVPPPEQLRDFRSYHEEILEVLPEKVRRFFEHHRPFEFRPVRMPNYLSPEPLPPAKQVWFRTVDHIVSDEDWLHRCLLAYVSDYNLLDTATLPHAASLAHLQMASIDHAMWFHRPFRADEWLLYSVDSPSASGARGFARGSIYARDGRLVASTAQEGLIRQRDAGPRRPR
ncbi:MAG TPA: acyl-CoA thioesterase II [Steroidobacteraceae bacterium]|nr:acyl-CoA thioesterase II [Steroidobacteraceae bacterium]